MSLIGSLSSGVSALQSFEQGIEVIGNNIANVNTTGYKDQTTEYSDSFSNLLQNSAPAPSGGGSNTDAIQIGTGVKVASIASNFQQGALESTGVNTDLAIAGNGFFNVVDPTSGTTYVTRAGNFRLDSNGNLVTTNGDNVQGLSGGSATYTATDVGGVLTYTLAATPPAAVGNIQISYTPTIANGQIVNNTGGAFTDAQVQAGAPSMQNYTVDTSGNVVISLSNGDSFDSGQVLLQNFSDPNALVSEGNNLFGNLSAAGPIGGVGLTAANNTPGTSGLGSIQSGALEQSNVDLSAEMANLITAERSFQAGSQLITVSDTILQQIDNLTH